MNLHRLLSHPRSSSHARISESDRPAARSSLSAKLRYHVDSNSGPKKRSKPIRRRETTWVAEALDGYWVEAVGAQMRELIRSFLVGHLEVKTIAAEFDSMDYKGLPEA